MWNDGFLYKLDINSVFSFGSGGRMREKKTHIIVIGLIKAYAKCDELNNNKLNAFESVTLHGIVFNLPFIFIITWN